MKLDKTVEGKEYILKQTGGSASFQERARSIGLVEGTAFKVIRNQKKMPLLIYARDTLLAVNRGDASKMEAEVL